MRATVSALVLSLLLDHFHQVLFRILPVPGGSKSLRQIQFATDYRGDERDRFGALEPGQKHQALKWVRRHVSEPLVHRADNDRLLASVQCKRRH